ncbi:alpha-hydroxy acid oxidase [Ilumatobacter nonamiensis]|uniref:alpha-hydroxy acid oxidase n=1 Tax=Ilumatobacter nonamiensis TaxID=467093 RepID=UPI0003486B85|nr:alpha-hydroxy acid oxidase [Ilumatobacter nonamiensis]
MKMWETFRSVAEFDSFELDGTKRRLKKVASIDDLRRLAKRRLPAGVFDYIDGGAEDERTLGTNSSDFAKLEFNPRILRDVSDLDTSTEIFGVPASMPIVLSPTGFTRIAHSEGELAVTRSAGRAGIPWSLSTMGTRSIEECAAANPNGEKWFQIYTWKDRGLVQELVARAKDAGYGAVWLTVDTAVLGRRERDVRRGMTLPPKLGPQTLIDGALHPAWTWDFLNGGPITFANIVGRHAEDGSTAITLADHVAKQFDQALSWDDIEWLRSIWDGPIVLKGIQTVADAKQAVAMGVEGLGLSNHGGRQLDDAPTPVSLIEPVRNEIGDQATIICDGGIRRGSDIVKAIALGADAVSLGRPYFLALGAAGEAGVDWLLDFYRTGLERTMALTGCRSLAEIDRDLVAWKR